MNLLPARLCIQQLTQSTDPTPCQCWDNIGYVGPALILPWSSCCLDHYIPSVNVGLMLFPLSTTFAQHCFSLAPCCLCHYFIHWQSANVGFMLVQPQNSIGSTSCICCLINRSRSRTRCWTNVVLMLAHRLRRWSNLKPTLAERLVYAGWVLPLVDE